MVLFAWMDYMAKEGFLFQSGDALARLYHAADTKFAETTCPLIKYRREQTPQT